MIDLNEPYQVFLGGMLGPVLFELLKIAAWRDKAKIDEKYSHPVYWICTGALLVVSGMVAVLSSTGHMTLLEAIQLGVNAPTIVAGYATAKMNQRRREGAGAHLIGKAALQKDQIKPKDWVALLSW